VRPLTTAGAHDAPACRRWRLPALSVLAKEVGGAAVCADLAEPAQLSSLLARIEDEGGPVDILVNNAGVALVHRLVDQDTDAIRQSFALDALAPLELTRHSSQVGVEVEHPPGIELHDLVDLLIGKVLEHLGGVHAAVGEL